jgi:hypothetical protein
MIGKVVRGLLDDSAALIALVPVARMFPYVMNEDTTLPAIVYTIDSVSPEYDKDGWTHDKCVFSVVSFSADYATLQSISVAVRDALELERGTVEGITVGQIYMRGQVEGYSPGDDIFLNKLTFDVDIIDY